MGADKRIFFGFLPHIFCSPLILQRQQQQAWPATTYTSRPPATARTSSVSCVSTVKATSNAAQN